MIFSDYKVNKIIQNISKPKIAINSFITIMKPVINLLYKDKQVIIQKILDISNKPIYKSSNKQIYEINKLFKNIINNFNFNYKNKFNSNKSISFKKIEKFIQINEQY